MSSKRAFTLLEILLVVAAIAILAGVVILAINPSKQLAAARNAQRQMDVNTIQKAVYQYSIDRGLLPAVVSTTPLEICQTSASDCTGLADLSSLTDNDAYLTSLPIDSKSETLNGTGYYICRTPHDRPVVYSPLAELDSEIRAGGSCGQTSVPTPISFWHLDDSSGCVANDLYAVNQGLLGQTCPSIAPAWISGKINGALNFTANTHRVVISDNNSLDLTNQGSMAAWINLSSYRNYGGVIHKGQLSNFSDSAYFMQMGGPGVGTSNNRMIVCGGNDGITDRFFVSNQELNLNTWYHVVCTWDESGQKMYINSSLDSSSPTVVVNRVTSGSLQIGLQVLNNYSFRGIIDEVGLWSHSLNPNEISQLYVNGL